MLDKDESIYILGVDSLLNGNFFYIEIWDNKFFGIFILFFLVMLIFDRFIVLIRIIFILVIIFISYFLYRIGVMID